MDLFEPLRIFCLNIGTIIDDCAIYLDLILPTPPLPQRINETKEINENYIIV